MKYTLRYKATFNSTCAPKSETLEDIQRSQSGFCIPRHTRLINSSHYAFSVLSNNASFLSPKNEGNLCDCDAHRGICFVDARQSLHVQVRRVIYQNK